MWQLFALGAIIASSSAARCGNYATPVWAKSYSVEGEISIPYAEVQEPFQAWYDEANGGSRIDYYGGVAKTFQFQNWPTQNGTTVSIVPVTTEEYLNKKTCYRQDGTTPGSVSLQPVLPDLTHFKCAGEGNLNGVRAQKWTSTVKIGEKTNKYIMWVQWRNSSNGRVPIPVYYEMKGYDTLMGSHFDHYYLSYHNYDTAGLAASVWDPPKKVSCPDQYPGPGERRGLGIMNPMAEFIGGDSSHHDSAYEDFVGKHHKTYDTDGEQAFRKYIFKQNYRLILAHNRAGRGYQLKVNHLADRTNEELKLLRGRVYTKESAKAGKPYPYSGRKLARRLKTLPEQFDWRLYGAVNPVKDQSICGSCWSFGTTGAVEGAYFVKTGKLISLSEQALVDCSWGYGNNGCDGGEDFRAYAWIKKHGGLPLEDEYGPYLAIDGLCHVNQTKLYAPIKGFVNVTPRNVEALKVALFEKGPISIGADASLKTFDFYSHGVYYDHRCHEDAADLDHSMLAVGYGTLDGKPYWLVKNSWSNKWGNDGYILISMQNNDCGITTAPTYVLM